MFCSRRKSPTAPCSCAYLLRGPVSELLNHLCCLGQATLVLRQQGLSLAKTTPFGLSIAYRDSAWHVLHDRLSGLETDTSRPQNVYLMTGFGDRRPSLAMAEPGKPVHLSIRLEGHEWESPAIRNLIAHFDGVSLDCLESRRLGAGAWLDEWERPRGGELTPALIGEMCQRMKSCRDLEVAVANAAHRGVVHFAPSFVDCSGTVLRIADRSLRHVVHADLADPGLRIQQKDDQALKMEKVSRLSQPEPEEMNPDETAGTLS